MKRRHVIGAGLIGAAGFIAGRALPGFGRDDVTQSEQGSRGLSGDGLKKGYLDGPYGQIHYYEQGQGPALILSHQSPVSARMFEQAMPLLAAKGIRAIAVDTPGYGNSDIPPAPPLIADYADAFLSVLDGLGLDEAHLLGHHTGGSIFCSFAARYPERVKSLILNGPPLFSAKDLRAFADIKHKASPILKDGSHLQAAWDRRVKYTPGYRDETAMHRRLVDQLWAGDTSWYGHNAAFKYDMMPDFMALSVPTLILTNTGDDIYHLAQRGRKLRPDFGYVELTGGTHDIVDEQPEHWVDAVADYII